MIYERAPAIVVIRPTATIITESEHRAMLGCFEPPRRGNVVRMTGTHRDNRGAGLAVACPA